MPVSIEVAVRTEAELGESPTWDHGSGTLVWVDILASQVHRYSPGRDEDAVLDVPQHVGAAKPRTRGGLVLNLRDGVALVDRDGAKTWLVYWARDGVRGNDAAVDPAGRLWAGTTRYDEDPGGWLARVAPTGDAKVVLGDVTCSNGIDWSPDGTLMYYVDSATRRIDVLDFDRDTGDATNRRTLVEVDRGLPDGLCVDASGAVWVALWGGAAVRRYTPDGRIDTEVELPVGQPSACAFGGQDFTDLYVTTARVGLSGDALSELAGSVLVLPGVGEGRPSTAFAG
ncbi:SMP-30/Gluconolaconase/LRE domain protein [Saccharothrix espanaensis DSM 44229]|uniref:SMP-30/Gluconolaconase/LRE domain protein n=1 Tax=Saccharothrix espanaensis (strain ATCC 51144 / DSM 44229 / JCM 9112 / NBRC 15066 / NRRL 15764) TaxID=1179773 RepID=K0JWC8_SACES|nr:SMP-30/Gluconolaconase/LRE domain protein [Saccharothrix espanaensis DSM 44229]